MNFIYYTSIILIGLYLLICLLLYLFQEKLIFYPTQLKTNHTFKFSGNFNEIFFKTKDGKSLNALLFKAKKPKGVIFYLHGNAASLDHWGNVAETYTELNYDVFIWDYRGYGKSDGKILSEEQLLEDAQLAYDQLKNSYSENDIIVLGYSLGSGIAANISANNQPKLLILQTPYYSLIDVAKKRFPILPNFLLKYPLKTHEFLESCDLPIVIFHGDNDELIDYKSSLKLKEKFKSIQLITLEGQGHKGVTYNPKYRAELTKLLSEF